MEPEHLQGAKSGLLKEREYGDKNGSKASIVSQSIYDI